MSSVIEDIVAETSSASKLAIPEFKQGTETEKLNDIAGTLQGDNSFGKQLMNGAQALDEKLKAFMSSPLPGTEPSHQKDSTLEETGRNNNAPSPR